MRRPTEMTLGIVGLGRIGKRMAHISRNVFKRVVAYDPHLIDGDFPAYVERARTLADLATQSDVVSLHTPLNAETRGLVGKAFFDAARPGLTLVNTARGAVVDLPALRRRSAQELSRAPPSTCFRSSQCRAIRRCCPIRVSS